MLLQNLMPDILGVQQPVRAAPTLFQAFRRHRLVLPEGGLFEQGLERIVADVQQGKSVLVCCNTVQRAQDMRKALLDRLPPAHVALLHSRFTMEDRLEHEKLVLQYCSHSTSNRSIAVVATQVVEVSLNIDLDTIYTDLAPLDALIQRFGRVNRSRTKAIVPVHVFREPRDGQGVYLENLVKRTLDVLSAHNGAEIDEAAVEGWLNEIYNTPEIRDPWIKEHRQQFQTAEGLLRRLRPFDSEKELEEAFEKLFDGVEVLREHFEKRYCEHITNGEFIEAAQLFVPISYKKCQQLRGRGKIGLLDEKNERRWIAKLPYNSTLGLLFEPAPKSAQR
jgi:CRISPR-associated endonuclease/helicase Cas3